MRITALLLAAAGIAVFAADFKLPPPYHTPSANNRPRVIPKPGDATLKVPDGFVAEKVADGFTQPRLMMYGPSKEILLSDSRGGIIWILEPERRKLIENLDRPYGMAWWNGYLYVGETTSVKRYKYDAKKMTVGAGEEIFPMKDYGKGHWTRCLVFDRAGKKLYVGVGSGSNVDSGEPVDRAAVLQMNPDGSDKIIYASGTRNPTMIQWYPGTDVLWASVQERDALGDDLVPDYFTHIQKGGFYGWPDAYIGPNADPRRSERPEMVIKTIVPDTLLGPHVAVIDFQFYTGKQFPKKYQGGAFLALHGSWNRSKRVGQSIGFIPFANGKPSGPIQNFLTGWMLGPDKQEVWGRPTGIMVKDDGSLLLSEDGNGTIWHVSYKGK